MRSEFVVLTTVALLLVPLKVSAKGDTVRITIKGGDLTVPIDIADPEIVSRFNVWTGPGTSSNESQGLIVDWSLDVAAPPKGLQVYEVSFLTSRRNPGTYVVRYLWDASKNKGYVYIPGSTDAEYRNNTWLIYRGNEGNWFHAWSAWEKLVHPLIVDARVSH